MKNKSEEITIISELDSSLQALKQNTFLSKKDIMASIIDCCKRFLILKGYRVVDPIDSRMDSVYKVKKMDDIADYFYMLLNIKYNPFIAPHRNKTRERVTTKNFIASRMEAGSISRQEAIKECIIIIKAFFDNIDVFNFSGMPDYHIFGQGKLGWITTVLVDIINKSETKERSLKLEERIDTLSDTYSNNWSGYNLDELLKNCEE